MPFLLWANNNAIRRPSSPGQTGHLTSEGAVGFRRPFSFRQAVVSVDLPGPPRQQGDSHDDDKRQQRDEGAKAAEQERPYLLHASLALGGRSCCCRKVNPLSMPGSRDVPSLHAAALSAWEVRNLMQHYKLLGREWEEVTGARNTVA